MGDGEGEQVAEGGSRAGTKFGPYELRSLIGRGGMGEVYEAFDTVKERVVALKLLPPGLGHDQEYRERFRREARTAARLQEPHVIPIHDFGEIDGVLYIDMRLVRGEDLKSLLKSGPLAPARAVAIITQVASALDAAHADGLVHRDVKPENVMITEGDFAYLADFGIASSEADTRLTGTGGAIGSVAYMAPERFRDGEITKSVDVYSLACLLFEVLTGQTPYRSKQVSAQITSHLHDPIPSVSAVNANVSPAMDSVLVRGLMKRPEQRFASAGALAQAATAALSGDERDEATTMIHRASGPQPTAGQVAAGQPTAGYSTSGYEASAAGADRSQTYVPGRVSATDPAGAAPLAAPAEQSKRGPKALWMFAIAAAAAAVLALGFLLADRPWDNDERGTAASNTPAVEETQPDPSASQEESPSGSESSESGTSESESTSESTEPSTSSSPSTTSETSETSEPSETSTTSTEDTGVAPGAGYGRSGWNDYAAARCNAGDPAMFVGRTAQTYLVVCQVPSTQRYYYKGYRPGSGNGTEIADPSRSGSGWTVSKDGYTYAFDSSSLVISQGSDEVANEPMADSASAS